MTITAAEARRGLYQLLAQVNDDAVPVEITSRGGDAVLLSRAEYDALVTTAHLLRSPANAARLMASVRRAELGDVEYHELDRS